MSYTSCIHKVHETTIRKNVCLERSNNKQSLSFSGRIALMSLESRRVSFACSLESGWISARRVTDMGLIKFCDVFSIDSLGTVQES
jgi:hypothetical protein